MQFKIGLSATLMYTDSSGVVLEEELRVDEILKVRMQMYHWDSETDARTSYALGTDSCNEDDLYNQKQGFGVSICSDAGEYGLYGDSAEGGSQAMELQLYFSDCLNNETLCTEAQNDIIAKINTENGKFSIQVFIQEL